VVDKQSPNQNQSIEKTRQERRERRLLKEKTRMPQHGKGLARVYKDAVSKRVKDKEAQEQSK
jgi:hypothetical protein